MVKKQNWIKKIFEADEKRHTILNILAKGMKATKLPPEISIKEMFLFLNSNFW